MREKEDFLVENKIKTEQDVKHNESRKQVVKKTTEYARRIYDEMMAKKKKQKNKLKNNKQEKLNKIRTNVLTTKIQNCFKQYKERKQLNAEIKKNMLLMEDFFMLTKNNEQMIAGVFNREKMIKASDYLKQFQKEQDKNIKILGEKKFNNINQEITNLFEEMKQLKEEKEIKQLKEEKTEQSISQQPTRPNSALSNISGISNGSSISNASIPNVKKNTSERQI